MGCGQGHVAFLVNGILIADVDGAVAHGQLLVAPNQDEAGGHQMRALLGLDDLQGGTDGVGGGIGRAAQQGVGVAHLHQHGAEVVALGQRLAALVGSHLALAQLHHLINHGVHFGIGLGVDDFDALDVVATLGRVGLDNVNVADEDGGQEAALDQAVGGFQNAGVVTLGKNDLSGVRFQRFDHCIEHGTFPPISGHTPVISPNIIYQLSFMRNPFLRRRDIFCVPRSQKGVGGKIFLFIVMKTISKRAKLLLLFVKNPFIMVLNSGIGGDGAWVNSSRLCPGRAEREKPPSAPPSPPPFPGKENGFCASTATWGFGIWTFLWDFPNAARCPFGTSPRGATPWRTLSGTRSTLPSRF